MTGQTAHTPAECHETKAPACACSTPRAIRAAWLVSSARFVAEYNKNPAAELSLHGVEKTDETGRLCRMTIAERKVDRN